MKTRFLPALAFALLVSACGGGSEPSESPAPVDPKITAQSEISTMLSAFSAKLESLEDLESASGFFTADFLHEGRDLAQFKKLVQDSVEYNYYRTYVKSVWSNPTVVALSDDGLTAEVSYLVTLADGNPPLMESMTMKKIDGEWKLAGNKNLLELYVNANFELLDRPMATADVLNLPRLSSREGDWEGQVYTYYEQDLTEAGAAEYPGVKGWVGRENDTYENWGRMIWTGDEYDNPWTDYDDRLLRQKYTQNISTPSSRVQGYLQILPMLPFVPGADNSPIRNIHVTGAGLPAAGLHLTRIVDYHHDFKIKGTNGHNFADHICAFINEEDRPENCGLDWSALKKGALLKFEYRDALNNKLGEYTYRIPGDVPSIADVEANKENYFATLHTSAKGSSTSTPEVSIANIFNDANGPFLPGKSVNIVVKTPALETVKPISYVVNAERCADHVSSCTSEAGTLRTVWDSRRIYKADYTPGSTQKVGAFTIEANTRQLKWFTIDIWSADVYGNGFKHAISPKNPK